MTARLCLSLTALLLLSAVAASAEPAINTLSDEEKVAGWKLLFDGKSTAGWRNYKKPDIGAGWKVENGALARADKGAGDIITEGKYAAFEFIVEYNISKEGNSGLMFHVTEEGG